jgi:hypothetical protein
MKERDEIQKKGMKEIDTLRLKETRSERRK